MRHRAPTPYAKFTEIILFSSRIRSFKMAMEDFAHIQCSLLSTPFMVQSVKGFSKPERLSLGICHNNNESQRLLAKALFTLWETTLSNF